MSTLFGKPPRMARTDDAACQECPFDATLATYLPNEPRLPVRLVESSSARAPSPQRRLKAFLITIGDRSVTGLVAARSNGRA